MRVREREREQTRSKREDRDIGKKMGTVGRRMKERVYRREKVDR